MSVRVVGPRQYPPNNVPPSMVNTTSRSRTWSRGLSPFYVGPVPLYEGAGMAESKNVENAWQYAKVYGPHAGPLGAPTPAYFEWARAGWAKDRGDRYPMGRGARPEYSWWAGEALDYIAARKAIYVPLYIKAVVPTDAFQQLLGLYKREGEVTLWDFDGFDSSRPFKELLNDPSRPLGHAFVLKALLEKLVPVTVHQFATLIGGEYICDGCAGVRWEIPNSTPDFLGACCLEKLDDDEYPGWRD